MAKGKAETEARNTPKGKGKTMKGAGKTAQANLEDRREDIRENRKVGDTQDSAGHMRSSWTQVGRVSVENRWQPKSVGQPEEEDDGKV